MHKFLIADNPMAERGVSCIIHMLEPISILLINEGHISTRWPHRHYSFTNSDKEQEQYTLSLYHCFVSTFDGEEQNIIIEKLFKQAWHWFMAYMNWEDQQIKYD